VTFQQAGPGGDISFGVYPNDKVLFADGRTDWVVDEFVNDRKVDGVKQDYAPHGRFPPGSYSSGDLIRLRGTGTTQNSGQTWIALVFGDCRAA
jgi:hypothetical protein